MRETLNVQARELSGKKNNRRLRNSGHIPAVLYGHGLDNQVLSIATADLLAALRHHSRLVDLKGAANESALISDIQWDTFGSDVLHVDFTRVSADERIEVEVAVELKGQAPGVKAGGVVEQLIREVRIECPAGLIPEKLVLSIKGLELDGSLTCAAIALPEGATLLSDADEMVVHCVTPTEESEDEDAGIGAEPELIGRKAADGDEEEEG